MKVDGILSSTERGGPGSIDSAVFFVISPAPKIFGNSLGVVCIWFVWCLCGVCVACLCGVCVVFVWCGARVVFVWCSCGVRKVYLCVLFVHQRSYELYIKVSYQLKEADRRLIF